MIDRSELKLHEPDFRTRVLSEIQNLNWRIAGEDKEIRLRDLSKKGIILPGMKLEDTLGRIFEIQAVHKNGNIVVKRELKYRIAWRPTEVWNPSKEVRVPRNE